jgi:hypothetical protein
MVELLTFIKATKILIASSVFHHAEGSSGHWSKKAHFYDDPVPGDSFPPNMFHCDEYGAGGGHAGTYRGL